MPLKSILSRPSTSASNKRVGTLDSTSQNSPKSTKSTKSVKLSRSPERGHRKIGSLQRLSLSFTPSHRASGSGSGNGLHNNGINDGSGDDPGGVTFHDFLTYEPDTISRNNSVAGSTEPSASRSATLTTQDSADKGQSISLPLPSTQEEEEVSKEDEEITPKPQRFSLMRFRYASEPQLSTRYKEGQTSSEPLPPPKIITTSPTHHQEDQSTAKSKEKTLPRKFSTLRRSMMMKQDTPFGSTLR